MSDGVSRETPPAPEVAAGVFSVRLEIAERYAGLLATDGVVRGLIGPREVPRLWERHLINCAVLESLLPAEVDVCDIGTGAGLPGVVLAIARPDLQVTLVEPLLRRTTFLEEAVAQLGLDNVEVVRARAEELHGRREFSVVTSRAVAPLERLLSWSMPLVRQGGSLMAMKGSSAAEELARATESGDLARWTSAPGSVEVLGEDILDPPTRAIRVEASEPSGLGLSPRSNQRPKGSGDPAATGRGAGSRRGGSRSGGERTRSGRRRGSGGESRRKDR